MHVVTYDIETRERIHDDPKPGQLSWDDARAGRAGVSAVSIWDNLSGRPHLYDGGCIGDCIEHLNSADLCIGWNSLEFDKPALEGFSGRTIVSPQLDVRQYVLDAVGFKYAKGYRLGEVTSRTLGLDKSGDGDAVWRMVEEGRWAEIFDYNLNDVWLTRALHNHIVQNGFIITPKDTKLKIKRYPTKELA